MDSRKSRAVALAMKRAVGNFFRAVVLGREQILPYLAVYHVNYRCNAACAFCSRAEDIVNSKRQAVNLGQVETLFRRLRQLVPSIYVSGGEPTIEPEIGNILKLAREVGFWPVTVNTNAIALDRHWDVFQYADRVVASLHTVSPNKNAKILGVSVERAERALSNIRRGAWYAKLHNTQFVVNCVVTEENVEEAKAVLQFCLSQGIRFAVVPAIIDNEPVMRSAPVVKMDAYRELLGSLLLLKPYLPKIVAGTNRYLKRIRDLSRFDCRPLGIVSVSPEGEIINPCSFKFAGVGERLGRAVGPEPVEALLRDRLDFGAKFASCEHNCLKACYLEPALVLENPLRAMVEYLR